MKKIPGKKIQQTIEIGAKFCADDGTIFESESDCKKYEYEAKRIKEEAFAASVEKDVLEKEITLGCDGCGKRHFIKKFETKEEFIKTMGILDTDGRYSFIDHYNLSERRLPEFPATFVVEYYLSGEYADSAFNSKIFNFIEVNNFIKGLQKDIETIKINL